MISTVPSTYITPEEYLARERQAESRSEYFGGEIFAMAGASLRHGRLVLNFAGRLAQKLRDTQCNVYATDIRLLTPRGLYTYPDVMVICGDEILANQQPDTVTNPILIIEVLSESTKDYDRGQKFESYRAIPSLLEYLTVAQDRIHIEHYTRQPDQRWILQEYSDPAASVALPSIGAELQIAEIYEKVEFSRA